MTNPSNPPPPSIGGSAKDPLMSSTTTQNRFVSHGTAAVLDAKTDLSLDGEDQSITSHGMRKRDIFRNFFRSAEPKIKTESARPETKAFHTGPVNIEGRDDIKHAGCSMEVTAPEAGAQHMTDTTKARFNGFSENMTRSATTITVPKPGARIDNTLQLALCSSLLPENRSMSPYSEVLVGASEHTKETSQALSTENAHREWVKATDQNPIEQDHVRWLVTCMVEEFVKDTVKGSTAIAEVILLGPVLDREHYRKLLSCFITEFQESAILDVDLLHGLVQLVQCGSEGFLVADDLVKILSIFRTRLQDTHQQSHEHPYHLTLAVSRLLDVMAEHKVQDVNRVKEHEPLSAVLSGLKSSSDPFLMYQASYAFQALQYVPDDETALQAVLRYSTGVAESLIKVTGVFKLDLGSVLEGLGSLQEALGSTLGVAKSGYEGIYSLMESGRGVFDSLKEGLGSGYKRPWYPALRAAEKFVRQGQLADLSQLIIEAPCRRDPLFQWGVCQLLGEIAADETWGTITRQKAIDVIVDLYKNDTDWARDESVKTWMLIIVGQLGKESDPGINDHASILLDSLKMGGVLRTSISYPLRSCLPIPKSSPLLHHVQDIPYVEYDLHQFRMRRLEGECQSVYIPPMAKCSLQDRGNDLFPLMEKVCEFLISDRHVMLILGDSGAGKSTFNRHLESELLRAYKSGGQIPLFINLPALDRPEKELITEQLRAYNFSDVQIQELKLHRQFIAICDGYDESLLAANLHTTNLLNRPGQWSVKLVVSCRSQYIDQDYRDRFAPQGTGHYDSPALHQFQEAVIVPFSKPQIENYVKQYMLLEPRSLSAEDYMEKLSSIPNLMGLVSNPFLLTLSLGALPSVVQRREDLSTVRITRVALYDIFVEDWIGANRRRLRNQKLGYESQKVLAELVEDDFVQNGINYQKDLAAAIFQNQEGKPFVDYTHKRDKSSWKAKFFGPEPEPTLLRGCSLLNRVGNQYRFIHRSVLEYFYSRFIYEPDRNNDDSAPLARFDHNSIPFPIIGHPLSRRNLVDEPSIIQFLCERVQQNLVFKGHLLAIIEQSKTDSEASQAAANAITILVRAGVTFNGADLKGIQVPGADMSRGQFDSAQLQGADLRNTNLRNVWLRQADLSNTQMAGVKFGEWPYLNEDDQVICCAYSPDGEAFAVGLRNGTINVYDTATWEKTLTLSGHTEAVYSVVYSSNGQQIASGSEDNKVQLWDAQTGVPSVTLSGHTEAVYSVALSPNGQQIASGSEDATVRLWDAQTGAPGFILSGHTKFVRSVIFSPSGQQIASGSGDMTVRLWDAQSGAPGAILRGHTDFVRSVVYSPSGQQIASGGWDNTVRLWDAQTGELGALLRGHTHFVRSVVFSPSCQQIASGSGDKTVRLWDAQTGTQTAILNGHADFVRSVVFSPSGKQIASGSKDGTVRLWDAKTGAPGAILSGHTHTVTSVVFIADGQQIASGSWDKTVRLWDTRTGAPGAILSGHTSIVTSVAYSPNGRQIASGSGDMTVRFWDTQTGSPGAILIGHTETITSVAFSPSGKQIASGSGDCTVRLWDARTGEPGAILSDHAKPVTSVVFSPSGHYIAAGGVDSTVRLWDAQTGESGAILNGHTSIVASVVFSPSGQQIATGGGDKTVRIWNARTGAPGAILSGHTKPVTCVVFSSNGQQIASGSLDGTVRLWDVNSSRCLAITEDFHGDIKSIAWNADPSDSYFATGCNDRSVRIWQVIEEEGHFVIRLRWSSTHDRLAVSDSKIHNVQGLSKLNAKLLKQRGALVKPIS